MSISDLKIRFNSTSKVSSFSNSQTTSDTITHILHSDMVVCQIVELHLTIVIEIVYTDTVNSIETIRGNKSYIIYQSWCFLQVSFKCYCLFGWRSFVILIPVSASTT